MNRDTFLQKYGGESKPIQVVLSNWTDQEVEEDLNVLVLAGVLTADGAVGDGLSDRISSDLHDGMTSLMSKIESYGDARAYLREALEQNEETVRGIISKIKGQIAENKFAEASGDTARLASSGSQEAWDVAVNHGDTIQYVQVKAYADPNNVVAKMREVQEKVDAGLIFDNGVPVTEVDFAIPHDIIDAVQAKAANYPELAGIDLIPLDITAAEAGAIVQEGLDNLGPEALSHLFDELLAGTATAAVIFSMINAVKVWRGSMAADNAVVNTMGETLLAGAAYSAGLAAEVAL
ncbi:hypothetical protein, partial [Thalassospira lucentensis]|uniref:hypothetical protein n=1 Tax=Thalassospira lucentensis TaxID=168935 RepID=UPI003AA960DA